MSGGREALGPRHSEVKRLRSLLRERSERTSSRLGVLEGPRLVAGALDRAVPLSRVYLGPGAARAFASLVARVQSAGVDVAVLKEGVLERVGTTATPQPVLAIAPIATVSLAALPPDGLVLVAAGIADPGNAGTLLRSAEAAGVAGVVFCGDSVDVRNPKVLRASAGAIFGVPVVEADDPVEVLVALGAAGRRRLGTVATGGDPPEAVELRRPTAIVLGNEAHGLTAAVRAHLDQLVTIPMAGRGESLNVATAGAILVFEAARQRRGAT